MQQKNIVFRAFKPVYYFSKLVAFMPVTYKSKKSQRSKVVSAENIFMYLAWSWLSVVYSGIWLLLIISMKLVVTIRLQNEPKPGAEGFSNFNSSNFNSTILTPPPLNFSNFIFSMNTMMDSICSILIIITGVCGIRKLPAIFRQFKFLDDYIDEDGLYLFGKFTHINICYVHQPLFQWKWTPLVIFLSLSQGYQELENYLR